jgi:hypothetical protein
MTYSTRLERVLAAVDPSDRAWLERKLAPPWLIRERRLAARDAAIRACGALYFADHPSGRAMASALRKALATPRSREGADSRRESDLRALRTLCAGRLPSVATIRRALAGLAPEDGSNSSDDLSHAARESDPQPGAAPGQRSISEG